MNHLKYLKLTTDDYILTPFPCYILSNTVLNLFHERNIPISKLIFTINNSPPASYTNLRLLDNLQELKIYFSVQNNGSNLERLIYYMTSLRNVNITFIEFIERNKIRSETIFNSNMRKSYFYKNIIESIDESIMVIPIDYNSIRNTFNFE